MKTFWWCCSPEICRICCGPTGWNIREGLPPPLRRAISFRWMTMRNICPIWWLIWRPILSLPTRWPWMTEPFSASPLSAISACRLRPVRLSGRTGWMSRTWLCPPRWRNGTTHWRRWSRRIIFRLLWPLRADGSSWSMPWLPSALPMRPHILSTLRTIRYILDLWRRIIRNSLRRWPDGMQRDS